MMRLFRSLRPLFILCVAAALGSAYEMWALYQGSISTNRVYLGTDTRSQCLFIGCALAVGLVLLTQRSHSAGRLAQGELWKPAGESGRAFCGAVGIVGAMLALSLWSFTDANGSFVFSGGFFLIGLATAGVILSAVGAPHSIVPRFLSLPPIRYIGQISYGLYIWHWPLFIWLGHERTGLTGYPLFFLRVAVTFGVSVLSFHLVERPIRRGTFVRQWKAWVAVPSGVAVVIVAVVAATTGTSAVASTAIGSTGAGATPTTTATSSPATATQPVRVLLFGDSVALTLGLGLGEAKEQDKYGYVLSDKGILGCGVVNGPELQLMGQLVATPSACNGSPYMPGEPLDHQPWPYQWLDAMAVTHPNVVVLLAGRWEVADRQFEGGWTNILDPRYAAYVKSQLQEASTLVTSAGAHIVYLTAPCTNEGEQPDGAQWPEDNPARLDAYNKLVREVAASHPKTDSVVDLYSAACPGHTFTNTVDGQVIRTTDGVHFTAAGGVLLAPKLMPGIVAAAKAQLAQSGGVGANPPSTTPPSSSG
jgi:lysophospholipase L1-like esterase